MSLLYWTRAGLCQCWVEPPIVGAVHWLGKAILVYVLPSGKIIGKQIDKNFKDLEQMGVMNKLVSLKLLI